MNPTKRNIAASVAARLLNEARRTGDDYQTLLTAYAFERFLYRLGLCELRDRFVLKGAMLLRLWSDNPYRATRDLDLLRTGDGSFDAIRADLRTICTVPVDPDGIAFEVDSIRVEAIRAEDEFAGTRATLLARCGSARLSLQVDMGLGDAVWPPPQPIVYPSLLDFPAPEVLAYPREAVVAEKLEALVVLGDRNSRIKDFFDLHHLANHFAFDRGTLADAVRRTFARRATPIPAEAPIGLTRAYWENPSRPAQVRAFARRSGLEIPEDPGHELADLVGAFLLPILDDLRRGAEETGSWAAGGPWRLITHARQESQADV
ncbi:MAG: nucleotidyl transferase AbiEii/AbiGii toxin family protein [Gemmatimonadota bacterium]